MSIANTAARLRLVNLILFVALAAAAPGSAVRAQEGFPLDGTWRGEWGTGPGATQVVMVMKWDGQRINGRIDPGPDALPFKSAKLFPDDWSVRIEAESADGKPIVVEGKLKDIGSYHRYVEGTWTEAGTQHPFKMTRQ